ncbi:MAG: GNAT family N-acetyltransferase [Chromatiales bacterium]|jgi:hypothetical protein|nr:GNAT family N-acetyltransferase [Chromatiales bacterium]
MAGRQRTFERPGECVVGATRDDESLGVGGLTLDPYADRPRVGRIRHVYLVPKLRGSGLGAAIVAAVLVEASAAFEYLSARLAF